MVTDAVQQKALRSKSVHTSLTLCDFIYLGLGKVS